MSDVTRILEAIERGEPRATDELLPLVYDELRKLAAHKMANLPPGQTLPRLYPRANEHIEYEFHNLNYPINQQLLGYPPAERRLAVALALELRYRLGPTTRDDH